MNHFVVILLTAFTFTFATCALVYKNDINFDEPIAIGCGIANDSSADSPDYGDLTCVLSDDGDLLARKTVISNGGSLLNVEVDISGANVTGVYALNFGRLHGFTGSITINRVPQDQKTVVNALIHPPNGPLRIFVEVYGHPIAENPVIKYTIHNVD